ncbi:MAG: TauD/TfdA family dioxygenase, partial [Rhodospirillaceae bacterium]|nr:TauD/TfdA family dioxygenase [Rhodospirillaceae bacterium]
MPDSMDLTGLDISPSGGGVGAFVNDIDLRTVGADEAAAIRLALGRNGVLFFRNQDLDPDAQIGFARKIGAININRFFKPTETHP